MEIKVVRDEENWLLDFGFDGFTYGWGYKFSKDSSEKDVVEGLRQLADKIEKGKPDEVL